MTCVSPHKCWCRRCRKAYDAVRFQETKDVRHAQKLARRAELVEWMRGLKAGSCADCGGSYHPVAMQFDHTGSGKSFNIGDLTRLGLGKDSIRKEIAKCDLVCSNCHAVRTHNRRVITQVSSPPSPPAR